MTDEPAGGPDLSTARDLVLRAFAVAQASGRDDWRTMSIAVLKNRLLDLTQRTFDEGRWGASTILDFVRSLDDIVEVDVESRPARVSLREAVTIPESIQSSASESARVYGPWQVRRDLWDAVMDATSGDIYWWSDGRVVQESGHAPEGGGRQLPTLTVAELNDWREGFAAEVLAADGDPDGQITEWRTSALSSQVLPHRYRNRWYGVLKRRVRSRLEDWFSAQALEPPDDLVSRPLQPERQNDVEQVRAAARRAIALMTRDELLQLQIPASVVARLLG